MSGEYQLDQLINILSLHVKTDGLFSFCTSDTISGSDWNIRCAAVHRLTQRVQRGYLHGGSSISFVMSVLLENSSVTSDFFTSRYIYFLASDIDIWIWIFWTNKECGRSFELSVICILSNWYKEEIRKVWIRIKNLCNSLITTQS